MAGANGNSSAAAAADVGSSSWLREASITCVLRSLTLVTVLGSSDGAALAAAFLNVAFSFCLGCEMYLIGRRVLHRAR